MLSDNTASSYVEGLAFHWYSGDYFEELEMFHKLYPNKNLYLPKVAMSTLEEKKIR